MTSSDASERRGIRSRSFCQQRLTHLRFVHTFPDCLYRDRFVVFATIAKCHALDEHVTPFPHESWSANSAPGSPDFRGVARILPGNLFSRIGVHRLELSPLGAVRKRVVVCDASCCFSQLLSLRRPYMFPPMATPITDDLTRYGTSGDENSVGSRTLLFENWLD